MNSVNLTGRIAASPKGRTSKEGNAFTQFPLAMDHPNPKVGESMFVNCAGFRHIADYVLTYLSKGDAIGVTGHLALNPWMDDDGNQHCTWQVIVDTIELLPGGRPRQETNGKKKPVREKADETAAEPDGFAAFRAKARRSEVPPSDPVEDNLPGMADPFDSE